MHHFVGCLVASYPRKLFAFQSCARYMHHFAGCLVASYPRKLFNLEFARVFTHSLSLSLSLSLTQPLQLNPTINTGYKRLNKITIKFSTELKPTKHIVINYNFTCFVLFCFLFFLFFFCFVFFLFCFFFFVFLFF